MFPPVRLTTLTASITRAVPATLICHIFSKSRTPLLNGSRMQERWITELAAVSRNRRISALQLASRPRSNE